MGTLFVDKLDPQSGTSLELGSSGDTISVPSGAELKTNKISPASGTAFTLGDSGDTFTIPAGATITNNGTQTGFGGTNTPLFLASMGGNQTISANTATKINFNREVIDSDNKYSTTDMRFSPGETGYYKFEICTTVEGAVGNSEHSYWYIYKNGSSIAINPIHRGHVAGDTMVTLFMDQATSSSDYYEAYFQQDVGNGFDVGYESGSSALSYWLGYKLIS